MAKTTIGILNVKLNAQTAAFGKGLKGASKKVNKFKVGALAGVAVLGAMSVAAVRAGRELYQLGREAAQYGDDLLNAANKINIATDELQALRFGARLTSVTNEKLDTSIVRLSRSIGEAIEGNKEYADTFERLNLNAGELSRMTPDKQVRAFADALSQLQTPAEKVAAAQQLMGRSGADLLPMLNQGSRGLDKIEAKFRSTGAAMDNQFASKLAASNAEFEFFGTMLDGTKRKIGAEVAPIVAGLGRTFYELGQEVSANIGGTDKLREAVKRFGVMSLNIIGDVVQGFTWMLSKTLPIFAAVTDAAAKVMVALARVNPRADHDRIGKFASDLKLAADDMRAFADGYAAINKALSAEGLGDRALRNMTELGAESKGFIQNLRDAAMLQTEIGRIRDMQTRSGADRFEQVVRSRIAIGGQRSGRNYGQMTVDRLDRLIEVASGPKLALAR